MWLHHQVVIHIVIKVRGFVIGLTQHHMFKQTYNFAKRVDKGDPIAIES